MSNRAKNTFHRDLILFVLWPFFATLGALRNFGRKESRIICYLFLILYGYTFVISTDYNPDAIRYAEKLKDVSLLAATDYRGIIHTLYERDGSPDVALSFIILTVSRFTNNHHVLFAIFAAVFGFFYLRSISLLYEFYCFKKNINALIFLIFFATIIPIFQINGFRFFTASWIFFYGLSHFFLLKKRRYLFAVFLSPLVHFSYFFPCSVFGVYLILGNRNLMYLALFFTSIFFPMLLLKYNSSLADFFGGVIEKKLTGYNRASMVEGAINAKQDGQWYAVWPLYIALVYLSIVSVFLRLRTVIKFKEIQNIFSFSLLFLACTNFGRLTPAFGVRFHIVFLLFATFFIFMVYSRVESRKVTLATALGAVPMLLYVSLQFRMGFESLKIWLFAPMPFPIIGGEHALIQVYNFFK